ncbi:hypothetical protein HHK36_014261 [Tetracentron sinense]|uniref:Uncharacterized protein n=1 Tax=Tetracentron sinense TaxID=13715 RepID=A0A834Z9G2_TETSI|nr:hypothetical protein HHK36_014261 [Tetracentron sinense]
MKVIPSYLFSSPSRNASLKDEYRSQEIFIASSVHHEIFLYHESYVTRGRDTVMEKVTSYETVEEQGMAVGGNVSRHEVPTTTRERSKDYRAAMEARLLRVELGFQDGEVRLEELGTRLDGFEDKLDELRGENPQ